MDIQDLFLILTAVFGGLLVLVIILYLIIKVNYTSKKKRSRSSGLDSPKSVPNEKCYLAVSMTMRKGLYSHTEDFELFNCSCYNISGIWI